VPLVSQAQRAALHAKADAGEIPKAVVDHFEAETPKGAKLPRRKKRGSALKRWAKS
jgi:hypothetical protein